MNEILQAIRQGLRDKKTKAHKQMSERLEGLLDSQDSDGAGWIADSALCYS